MAIRARAWAGIRASRGRGPHACRDHLVAAPLWPVHGANPGTLLRTCEAVGTCLAVPRPFRVPDVRPLHRRRRAVAAPDNAPEGGGSSAFNRLAR